MTPVHELRSGVWIINGSRLSNFRRSEVLNNMVSSILDLKIQPNHYEKSP